MGCIHSISAGCLDAMSKSLVALWLMIWMMWHVSVNPLAYVSDYKINPAVIGHLFSLMTYFTSQHAFVYYDKLGWTHHLNAFPHSNSKCNLMLFSFSTYCLKWSFVTFNLIIIWSNKKTACDLNNAHTDFSALNVLFKTVWLVCRNVLDCSVIWSILGILPHFWKHLC